MNELYSRFLSCNCRLTTDSRSIQGGEIFLALKGENFNGNLYAKSALDAGAAYAVVDASCPDEDSRFIRVEDTLKTLWDLASWHREKLNVPELLEGGVTGQRRHLTVIGLTGTNGKTTTKELIRSVLSSRYRVSATEGNLNNNIGVPLTVLKFSEDCQIALVEMGASHPGDIKELVEIARPDIALITNVGKAHLLGFGSFDGVKATKAELYDFIDRNSPQNVSSEKAGTGKVFINADNAHLLGMAMNYPSLKTISYGVKNQSAVVLRADSEHPYLRMIVEGVEVNTNLVGSYNADNVMAAIAVGHYFGISTKEAAEAISAYVPENKRSQMSRTERNTLILDAYNANPSSMAVALDNFASVEANQKIVMLGDMRELGEESAQEHLKVRRRVEDMIAAGQIDKAFFVGEEFGRSGESYADSESLAKALADMKIAGATILVKGSRGIKMENVIPSL